MADKTHTFECSCGVNLEEANVRIDSITETGEIELCVECPECDAEFYAYVAIDEFVEGDQ